MHKSARTPLIRLIPLVILAFGAGCATVNVQRIPPQEGIYPPSTAPDAPLVLAIPGLVVPGLPVKQEQHFGFLVQMLAEKGIPCRILLYNTPKDPVVRKAALYSPELSIASTRVGPAIVSELQRENKRREALGLPRVKKLVLFGYSQGGVIMAQIGRRVFYKFRNMYEDFSKKFPGEWDALQKDPEFELFIDALDDYIAVKRIKDQYPRLFEESPALTRFDERVENKLEDSFERLLSYLTNPATVYPHIKTFEPPDTPYYPKMYGKIREYAMKAEKRSEEEKKKNLEFFKTYAQYRDLLTVEPYFITASASLFGSPQANDTLLLVRIFPWLKLILGREYYQIRQTMLGTVQQIERIENLVREQKDKRYPIDPVHVLFMLGANGTKGDGFVDQPAAHISRHTYTLLREVDDPETGPRFEVVEQARLPGLVVVPLHVMHFPEKILWGLGGTKFGAAYMVKGNPAFPYLLHFIRGEWDKIDEELARSNIPLTQFMVQISTVNGKIPRFRVWRKGQTDNIRINGRYYNPESGTLVWVGYFRQRSLWNELTERARLLNPAPIVPGLRDLLCREGTSETCRFWEQVRLRSELLNPLPLIPGEQKIEGWTRNLFGKGKPWVPAAAEPSGEVRFSVHLTRGKTLPLTVSVYPGRISFVRLETLEDGRGGEKRKE